MSEAVAPMLLEAMRLKAVPRAGWLRAGIGAPESVAAHSWGIALIALSVPAEELDLGRVLAFATLHDLAEVRTGDITPHDPISAEQKHTLEHAAATAMLIDSPKLFKLWRAYEAQACAESRWVRQLDRLDMALQAIVYAAQGHPTAEFIRSARRVIQDARLVAVLDAALATCAERPGP